jgi:hypothetical protein
LTKISKLRSFYKERQAGSAYRKACFVLKYSNFVLKASNDDDEKLSFEKNHKTQKILSILKKILKYLKLPKVQQYLKVTLMGLGVSISLIYIYNNYLNDIDGLRIPFLSKLLGFFKSLFSDQDSNVNDALEKAKTSNKWGYLFVLSIVLGLGVLKIIDNNIDNKENVVEIDIQPEYINIDRQTLRKLTGSIMFIVSHPIMLYVCPPLGLAMYISGWQLATHP